MRLSPAWAACLLAGIPARRGWLTLCEPISTPAAASSRTPAESSSGHTGPVSQSLVPPTRPEMMNAVAPKPCRASSGIAASSMLV